MARLPSELLLHIVHCLIPTNSSVAFPASHVVTRTLLSLSLVSRAIHEAAIRHLYAHCLYIDTPNRLKLLQQTVANDSLKGAVGTDFFRHLPSDKDVLDLYLESRQKIRLTSFTRSLFLAPFPGATINSPEIA